MTTMEVDQVGGPAADAMEVEEAAASAAIFAEMMDKARDLETTNPEGAIKAYKDIINDTITDDPTAKGRETAIYALAEFFVKLKRAQGITDLSKDLRKLFTELPKAKTAKIVRTLIEQLALIEGTHALQIEMCSDCVDWCKQEKRSFLRQRVETRLSALYLHAERFVEALELLTRLLSEVKKLDDKLLLVEIFVIECRTHYALQNVPKAKASLTAAKTNANAIHCPPLMQAEIDLWSGVLCAREKDHRTSFSYFYEAFEAYNAAEKLVKAKVAIKYMLLSKIMMGRPQETKVIIGSKSGMKYTGSEIDAMAAVAKAQDDRCLKKLEAVLLQYKTELKDEPIISYHLNDLTETLLEQNILRILEPYSHVELAHVAELIELPLDRTMAKLSEMILDKKLNGTLDQGVGVLIVFEAEEVRSTYGNALTTIKNTSEVLDTLYGIAKQLP